MVVVALCFSWLTCLELPSRLLHKLAHGMYFVALAPSSQCTVALRVAVLDEGVGLLSV